MTRIENVAVYITTAQKSNYSALDGQSKLNVINNFFNNKGIEKPVSITVTTTKKGVYLTKDEKLSIQNDYINALVAGCVTDEVKNNFDAISNPELVVTFSETLPYNEAVNSFGPAVVAAKMIDMLPIAENEEFHKIRKFDVPALVSVSEIPALIEELKKIYKENNK